MSRTLSVLAMLVPLLWTPAHAWAGVLVTVDLAKQHMTVDVDGARAHSWSVSTARADYVTTTGSFRPQRMHKMWYSRKYDNAPMPHAIFYSGGYAIHGTTSVRMLGRPASHGCVRLAPAHAAALFALVQRKGMAATRIVIRGVPPAQPPKPAAVAQRPQTVAAYRSTSPTLSSAQPGLLSDLFGVWQPTPAPARQLYLRQPHRPAQVSQAPASRPLPLRASRVSAR